MKKLDQYLLREMCVPFLIGTGSVVLMFQANAFIYLGKTFNLENVPIQAIWQFIFYNTPGYLNQTLAVGMSLGSSLAMSRFARESELTALRAVGTSIRRTLVPILGVGVVVAIGNFFLAEKVMAPATQKAYEIGYRIGLVAMGPNLKQNAVIQLRELTIVVGQVQRNGKENLSLERVMIVRQDKPKELTVTLAPKGLYNNGVWTFTNARIWNWAGDDFRPAEAKTVVVNERILTDGLFALAPVPEEKTAAELQQQINLAREHHEPTKRLEVGLQQRFAIPAACVVFSLVGPVFAIMFARSGGFVGVMLSIILVWLYFNAMVISTEILSKLEFMPAWLAVWLPNILFASLGAWGVRRLE